MARILVTSNGDMLVNLSTECQIRDIYYPLVGQENHAMGQVSRFGFWVDGECSWLDSPEWQRSLHYEPETLVTQVTAVNARLQLRVDITEAVDIGRPVYLRKVVVHNQAERPREVKLFFHSDLNISGHSLGDTVYYDPVSQALIHFKGKRYFLLNAATSERIGLEEYATGIKQRNGAKGTWYDAEDGRLERCPISHGSVDATAAVTLKLPPQGSGSGYWWLVAGQNYQEVTHENQLIGERTPEFFMERTRSFWKLWVNKQETDFADLPPEVVGLYKRSLLMLRAHIDNRGAILAASDSDVATYNGDTYSYVWPRDGALTAMALVDAGDSSLAQRFFEFCASAISDEGFLLHKYNPDGSAGSSWHPWVGPNGERQLPIQEDETALVIAALWHHWKRFRDVEMIRPLYSSLVKPAADFLVRYRDSRTGLPLASYDLWEERRGITAFAAGCVWAGLRAAARFVEAFGEESLAARYQEAAAEVRAGALSYLYDKEAKRFLRSISIGRHGGIEADYTLDSSLYGLFAFGMLEASHPWVAASMKAIADRLWCPTPVGGMARYDGDSYWRVSQDLNHVPGNPWVICTLWLADWYIEVANTTEELQKACGLLRWVQSRALPGGALPEQLNPYTGEPIGPSPLTWSHATAARTIHRYAQKYRDLERQESPPGVRRGRHEVSSPSRHSSP